MSIRIAWRELWSEGSSSAGWSHSGIAVTDRGRVVFAEPDGGGLVLLRLSDGVVERHPLPLLELHGIFYARAGERDFIWVADPGFKAREELGYEVESRPGRAGRVDLSTLEFEPLEQPDTAAYSDRSWEPTSVVAIPATERSPARVFVADGYGENLVHLYVGTTFERTLTGIESGTAFSCPHGLLVDTRTSPPTLLIADRGNRRLLAYTLDGTFVRSISDDLFTSPSSLALRGNEVLVTELDGALLAVDTDDSVRPLVLSREGRGRAGWPNAVIDGRLARPPLSPQGLNSPHGIAVSRDGRIYLTEWVIGGRQWELTLSDD